VTHAIDGIEIAFGVERGEVDAAGTVDEVLLVTGTCVLVAPDVFDQRDEDGIVVLLDEAPGADQHDAVREAASVCPGAAIRLLEP
jgi:ferredoxin